MRRASSQFSSCFKARAPSSRKSNSESAKTMKSNRSAIVANLLLALLALLTVVSSVGALPAPVPAPQVRPSWYLSCFDVFKLMTTSSEQGCNAGTSNTNLGGDQVNQAGGDQEVLLSSNKLCILRKVRCA